MNGIGKKKSLLRKLLPWAIAAVIVALLVIFVFIPMYSVKESTNVNKPIVYAYSGDGQPITMENEKLLFTMDPKTTQFTLLQKKSNHTWYSNPADIDNDPVALPVDKEKLKSTLMLTYSTKEGIKTIFNNYSYSIENGVYDVEVTESGAVRVTYTVGKVNKIYYIPVAIPESRMDELTASLSKSDKRKATSGYRLYNINKLKASDDAEALKAKYPTLVDEPMYILRDGTADHVKAKLLSYFDALGYTADDYYNDLKYIVSDGTVDTAVFNVTVEYSLDGGDLLVKVPYEEIRYNDAYPIVEVTPLPYFGATSTDEEGFALVPDGGGALIYYNNGKLAQNSYFANLYGWDWAQERKIAVSETRASFPLFGMTGGGNAFICMLESNEAFAGIQADISGRGNSYNTASAKYYVLHADQYDVSTKSNNLVFMYEAQVPAGTVQQRYRFIDTDSYVDMASTYRTYLMEKFPNLHKNEETELPINVQMLGAIDKTQQRMGVPMSVPLPMTTFEQAESIMNSLLDANVQNLNIEYTGWANGGVQQRVLTSVDVVDELGDEKGLETLVASAKEKNVDLYLDGAACFAYDSNLGNGFLAFRDAAKYTTRDKVLLYPYSTIWYTPMKWRDESYLVKPAYMVKCAQNLVDATSKYGATGVMFRDVGSILSADYNNRDLVTREQSKQLQLGVLREASDKDLKVAVKLGYDYTLAEADYITEMDMVGGSYSILDRSIPFYQIALHGLVEYTGNTINVAGDYMEHVLRAAEYGAGLNFCLMNEQEKVLQDSFYSGYFAANFEQWNEKIIQIVTQYQKDMAGVADQRIVRHTILSDKVAVTTYENGVSVYVNYGETEFSRGSIVIPARNYIVKGGR